MEQGEQLDASEAELAAMEHELAALREAYAGALVKVAHGEATAAELPVAGLALDLYFRSGSDVVDERAAATLARFAALLNSHPGADILITGVTRSFPADTVNSRNSSVISAQTVCCP